MKTNPLVPAKAKIVSIREETSDIKTFEVEPPPEFPKHIPGQCAMVSVFGVGEALFSITSPPEEDNLEFSIKKTGKVTDELHSMEAGTEIGLRGPYGNGFPVEEVKGKNLLFIGGGIGLAPLRSLIKYALNNKEDYGSLQLIYGARTPDDLAFKKDIYENWPNNSDISVNLSVDVESPGWDGYVGFVPQYLEELSPSPEDTITFTCGPPIMIKFVVQGLEKLGFTPSQVISTLEYKMKCGVGKCGRCNIGEQYVCKDGPVFTLEELKELNYF
ncbi:FAD/NAD(P)-binding protein [Natranaerofaba carboxydovora]|uniref:FAD/NAD(P)-binding protein n=1 Tax=Natranaerofaba carboxydovora TaxID=2742683 RepID=UPI001F13F5E8|nr:FAD/NAD(P)-binding protein [Natranaerofaba carboxydovora]UMZ75465.1 Anaerobic sulfite reductase subunit B [Natranaerofaba carboxydovora]